MDTRENTKSRSAEERWNKPIQKPDEPLPPIFSPMPRSGFSTTGGRERLEQGKRPGREHGRDH